MLRFPEGFLFGAATSSHQVEGDNRLNDWWDWEAEPGRIRDGTRSEGACGWWSGRAEDDLRLAASLGHNAHRMSLEWSRLEPTPGRYDEAAFERYRAIADAAREAGLRLMVTINHFTLPRWAAERGSWLWDELAPRFAELAAECLRHLGDRITLWATLNEPTVLAFQGYAGTRWPPGLGSLPAARVALVNQLRAHAAAYHAMHEISPAVQVGLVVNAPHFEPFDATSALDRAVATTQSWVFTDATLAALKHGRLLPPLGTGAAIAGLGRAYDFIGLNYYGRYRVRFDARQPALLFGAHAQEDSVRTEWTDWGEPWAHGLAKQLERLAAMGVPLYVTENGIFDPDDRRRPRFVVAHLTALHAAIQSGVDVRGYFHWTLTDNFEWAEGWSTPFGLVALDRHDGSRRPKLSATIYARISRIGGIDELVRLSLPPR
jgi:beta-glucosidase